MTSHSSDSITYRVQSLCEPHSESLSLLVFALFCFCFVFFSFVDSLLFLDKLLIYKLWCWSLSQKLGELSLSQGFSAFTICLSSGSISFI